MNQIISLITTFFASKTRKLVIKLLSCIELALKYLIKSQEIKQDNIKKEKDESFDKKVENVVDNGNIEDLLDLKYK